MLSGTRIVGSGSRAASNTVSNKDSYSGVKQPERETDHSPTNAVVKKTWMYASTLPGVFICGAARSKSTVTEGIKCPIVPTLDDGDSCGPIS
jgi:hypothetical protein